jgi:osmotically-inducible protein OsmY
LLLLAACERPAERVNASGAENNSRNPAPAAQVANELAREPQPNTLATQAAVPAPTGAISDTVIAGKVKAELITDPGMEGADVSVSADHGVVILAGTVGSYEQSALASAHAQQQDGVMRVDNQLSLSLR